MAGTAVEAEKLVSELDTKRSRVDVDNLDISVQELIRMARGDELHIAPVYQRKFRWTEQDQSALIESILLGLPIPTIYVAQNKTGEWELVDGLQRISTLLNFVPPEAMTHQDVGDDLEDQQESLNLSGLNELPSFNGCAFGDLPVSVRMKFLKRPMRVTALSDKAKYDVRFDVFERLNKGGIQLTRQEVRSCVFYGEFTKLLRELAAEEPFVDLVKLKKVEENDGTKEEIVLKFFAYLNNRMNFVHSVEGFLDDYMISMDRNFDVAKYAAEFRRASKSLAELVDPPLQRNKGVTPKLQLEAALVAIADILRRDGKLEKPHPDWMKDKAFMSSSGAGSNTKAKLLKRIERATELLQGAEPIID